MAIELATDTMDVQAVGNFEKRAEHARYADYLKALECSGNPPPGLYMALKRGRPSPLQPLVGSGTDGPIFGPLSFVQMSYLSELTLQPEESSEECMDDVIGPMTAHHPLCLKGQFFWYEGVYYGEVEFFEQHRVEPPKLSDRLRAELDRVQRTTPRPQHGVHPLTELESSLMAAIQAAEDQESTVVIHSVGM